MDFTNKFLAIIVVKFLQMLVLDFQGFSRGIFHRQCHVVSSEYIQDCEQCCPNVLLVPQHRTVQTFHRSKLV